MVIRVFKDGEAVAEIKRISQNLGSEHIDKALISAWYLDKAPSCYILYEDNVLKSFALVTKCDFDPLNEHKDPHVLNYIYTLEEFRNEGYALDVISFIKSAVDFSCFCMNAESVTLFSKAGCRNHGELNNTIMLRHP